MKYLILFIIVILTLLFFGKLFCIHKEKINNIKNNEIIFFTYGGPAENYYRALKRIENQAKNINVFTKINIYNDKNLIDESEFWNKHSNFILNNNRGYGYWIWKPYLNYKIINESNENDIIVYADAGCEININCKEKLNEYVNILKKSDTPIIVFEMPQHLEKAWTKKDTLIYLDCDTDNIINTGQIYATWFMYRNCNHTRKIINEWYDICSNNYYLIDDSPSVNSNYPEFIENRHDQSIFSLLCKKYGCIKFNDEIKSDDPILPVRNRDG